MDARWWSKPLQQVSGRNTLNCKGKLTTSSARYTTNPHRLQPLPVCDLTSFYNKIFIRFECLHTKFNSSKAICFIFVSFARYPNDSTIRATNSPTPFMSFIFIKFKFVHCRSPENPHIPKQR